MLPIRPIPLPIPIRPGFRRPNLATCCDSRCSLYSVRKCAMNCITIVLYCIWGFFVELCLKHFKPFIHMSQTLKSLEICKDLRPRSPACAWNLYRNYCSLAVVWEACCQPRRYSSTRPSSLAFLTKRSATFSFRGEYCSDWTSSGS